MEIDKKIIKKLIESLEELKKTFNKSGEQLDTTETSKSEEVVEVENSKSVKSPIIGTAYLAPEPGAKPFVEVGKKIKKGDTVMIVEAMKTMNHIPSPHNGIIKKITVQDGQPVEYDQVLVLVE
tara:strand:+ start:411 stop:779 length:369 start_codon:yes stop_codon:yes gene_type:complete